MRNLTATLAFLACCLCPLVELSGASSARVYHDRQYGFTVPLPKAVRVHDVCATSFGSTRPGHAWTRDKNGRLKPVKPKAPAKSFSVSFITAKANGSINDQLNASVKQCSDIKALDYYRSPKTRPFAASSWAPKGISGAEATIPQGTVAAYQNGEHFIAVCIRNASDPNVSQQLIDQLEMFGGPKADSSWAESQSTQKMIKTQAGTWKKASTSKRPTEWKDCHETQGRYHQVFGICEPDELATYTASLDALYAKLSELLPPRRQPHVKFRVYLGKTHADFLKMAGGAGQVGNRVFQGLYSPMTQAVYTFTDKIRGKAGDIYIRLHHECTHQYLYSLSGGNFAIPFWLHEAMAVLMENGRARAGKLDMKAPKTRLLILKQVYKQKKQVLVPFANYLAGRQLGNVHQYAEVYAMLHYLLYAKPDGMQNVQKWWQQIGRGGKSIQQICLTDMTPEQWQTKIMDYVLAGKADRFPR